MNQKFRKGYKDIAIGKRLMISFIIIALLGSIGGLISTVSIKTFNEKSGETLQNYGFATGNIAAAIVMTADSRRAVRDIVQFSDKKDIEKAEAELAEIREKHEAYREAVVASLVTDEEKALMEEVDKKREVYREVQDKFVELGKNATEEEEAVLQAMMIEELDPAYDDLYKAYQNLHNYKKETGIENTKDLYSFGKHSAMFTIGLVIVTFVLAVFSGRFVSGRISKPIVQLVELAEQIEGGELDVDFVLDSQDEIGMLTRSFKNMADNLRDIIEDIKYLLGAMAEGNFRIKSTCTEKYIGDYEEILLALRNINTNLSNTLMQINHSAEQVAVGAEQMATGAENLSEGSMTQASNIEELSGAVIEISQHIGGSTKKIHSVNDIIMETSEEVTNCDTQMKAMVNAMADISNTSNEISKIIKAIEDIAFQTNILALNAAVEAARAGEAGKGFAVVADEVRNLAQKSAEAAKDTTSLIENAINAVGKGTEIVDGTASSLAVIVEQTAKIDDIITEILGETDEESTAINQVTQGLDEISHVVQTNSATAQESAATCEELNGQAEMLKEMVDQFKLKEI
ncbi:MAG: methyl-accepting chemotaxis protein [Anaerovoracaceae bacterium]